MTVNSILDYKFDDFVRNMLSPAYFEVAILRRKVSQPDSYTPRILNFINNFEDSQREYILRKFMDLLNNYDPNPNSFRMFGGKTDENIEFFNHFLNVLKGDLFLQLQNISDDLNAEMFNKEEWEELKKKIDTISEQLFELIKRNDAGHEVIYNSVEEIKDDLLSKAESGKIFGKEFVQQQLSGKILDMAFKGSFFAMLSHAPEKLSSLSEFVQKLL